MSVMRDPLEDLVLEVVAQHMLVDVEDLKLSQHVRDDLDLDPLDLVLIALRLEDIEDVEFPIDALEEVEVIGDFTAVLRDLRHTPKASWSPPVTRRDFGDYRERAGRRDHETAGLRARRHA